jgi:coenzyme F420-dependent glucose-6-phosphate dehydrogenase
LSANRSGYAPAMTEHKTRYWFSASHEQFPPSALIEQAMAAQRAGFDGIGCSDHFAPWWPEGQSGFAWTWLGAIGQAIDDLPIGTGVTALVHRYHPAIVAQAFMTLEEMFPSRVFLGVGSGEALNEVPCGADWPPIDEQIARMESGTEAVTRLWAGETLTFDGGWFRCREAKLYTRARGRPKLYVSAFGRKAAQVAGKWGDGIWILADPQTVPEVLAAYRESCAKAGREPGEIILHTGFAWAADEQAALEGARPWRGTVPDEVYTEDIHTPEAIQELAQSNVDDDTLKQSLLISADPDVHVERLRQIEDLGATVICLQNMSGADPMGTIETYRQHVLPAVRGARV